MVFQLMLSTDQTHVFQFVSNPQLGIHGCKLAPKEATLQLKWKTIQLMQRNDTKEWTIATQADYEIGRRTVWQEVPGPPKCNEDLLGGSLCELLKVTMRKWDLQKVAQCNQSYYFSHVRTKVRSLLNFLNFRGKIDKMRASHNATIYQCLIVLSGSWYWHKQNVLHHQDPNDQQFQPNQQLHTFNYSIRRISRTTYVHSYQLQSPLKIQMGIPCDGDACGT